MNEITVPRSTAIQPVLVPTNFDQLVTFSEMAARTEMVPKDFRGKPGNIMLAVQMGSELGLSPMQALSNIAIINGRAGVWGDALIGICRQSPLCENITETMEGEGDNRVAVCVAKRRGASPVTARFSVADAKRAELWGKDIWKKYPERMLQNRARGFALRDAFPDLLRGLKTGEELIDTPRDTFNGPTLEGEVSAEQARPPQAAPGPRPVEGGGQRRTIGDFLDGLDRELEMVPDADAADALLNSPRIEEAKQFCKNGAAARLADWISRAQRKAATLRAAEAKRDDEAEAAVEGEVIPPGGSQASTAGGSESDGWPGGDLVFPGERFAGA